MTITYTTNVLSNGEIEVRQNTISSDNVVSYQRWVIYPGQNISNQDITVQAIANQTWTQSVLTSYQDLIRNIKKN